VPGGRATSLVGAALHYAGCDGLVLALYGRDVGLCPAGGEGTGLGTRAVDVPGLAEKSNSNYEGLQRRGFLLPTLAAQKAARRRWHRRFFFVRWANYNGEIR